MARHTYIRHDPSRIFYMLTAKCGSSSVIAAFLLLAGLPEAAARPHAFRRDPQGAALMARHGMVILNTTREDLLAARAANPGYVLVANVRDPAQRLVSNYFNKINRYAKRFARPAYACGKLAQLVGGPRAWPDVTYGNRYMRRLVDFDQFLDGLERHGTGFDPHFASQARSLDQEALHYDSLVPLETLTEALPALLASRGIDPELLGRLSGMPRMNATEHAGGDTAGGLLTPARRARISRLYADDYALLGYEP